MLRRLLDLLTALSLLLSVAACVLWVRGYEYGELLGWWEYRDDGRQVVEVRTGLFSCEGGLGLGRQVCVETWPERPADLPTGFSFLDAYSGGGDYPFGSNAGHWWEGLGFAVRYPPGPGPGTNGHEYGLTLPCWFVFLLACVLPARWVLSAMRRKSRRDSGLCAACGYDLRATPGRCPECGYCVLPTGEVHDGRGT